MSTCMTPWNTALIACADEVGFGIPVSPTSDNVDQRVKICASDTCHDLTVIFRALIAGNCTQAIEQQTKYPDGIWTDTYCPKTLIPPVTRAPNTTAPTPNKTTAAPTTTPPIPTTIVPVTTTPGPVTPEPTTPTPTSQQPQSASGVAVDAAVESGGSNRGAIIGASAGGVVVLVLIILAIVFVRRKRRGDAREGKDLNDHYMGHLETAVTTRTEPTTTHEMWGGLGISLSRIPYEKIKVGELISQGGFGEVFRGSYNGQPVAVKRLLASRRKDKDNLKSFLDEIKLTSSLDHECIVKFIGVAWDAPSDLCMVSELMVGGDLRSLLTDKARSGAPHGYDDEKLRIAVQVAHALTYLHSLLPVVVHRDLKSRNILLTQDHDAKLIDFGVSTEERDVTMTAGVGTSLWMAPEVMMGERYDEKADIFSFGVVLSELDTHELPYSQARDTTSSSGRRMPDLVVMQQVALGRLAPQFSEAADPDIVALARDCLAVQPKLRPAAADVLYRIHKARKRASVV